VDSTVSSKLDWNDNPNIIQVPEGSVIAPNLKRPVHIPNGGGAYQTAPGWGVHWVASAKDYTFTVNPLGENRERKLIVSTSDDKYDETIGYLKIDGVWVVTLPVVQKAMNLEISFESAEEPSSSTGSAAVEGTNVWAGSGAIYIAQAQAGSARIYSAAGTLVKTVATPAGETAGVAIAPGFYIVKLNEGNFKVIVK
jgi:hypothetical protein